MSALSHLRKRAFDLALAVPALIVSAPAIAALAVAVKLDSPGPAFYAQTRLGRGRRPFRVYKLRSMVADADRAGAHVTAAGDARITRIGRILRRAKLDELPQLWNVVRGDMSIVGPRPEAERYVRSDRPEWERIFAVRPGLTDPATIAFREEESLLAAARDRERAYLDVVLPAKLRIALEGVDRSSLLYDARVVLDTLGLLLPGGRRAPHPAFEEARHRLGGNSSDD